MKINKYNLGMVVSPTSQEHLLYKGVTHIQREGPGEMREALYLVLASLDGDG